MRVREIERERERCHKRESEREREREREVTIIPHLIVHVPPADMSARAPFT